MENAPRFTSELIIDLPVYQEYQKLNEDAYPRNVQLRCLSLVCQLFLLLNISNSRAYLIGFLFLSVIYLILPLIQKRKNKDGGVGYKQILHSSGNAVPHQIISFTNEGIITKNLQTEAQISHPYDTLKYVMESENLLLVVNDIRMCQIVDKRTLTGGSREEFLSFLQTQCPKMKKRVKTGRTGRFLSRTMIVLAILGSILALGLLFKIPQKLAGQLTNDMSYQEMAQELEALDITISQQTFEELEAWDAEYATEYGGEFYRDNPYESKISDLLYWEGSGSYDAQTQEWVPSTSGIYWFDTEIMYANRIYSDFFTGLSAMNEELYFANVQEDYSQVDVEAGTGTVILSFDYMGKHYILEAEYYYDWFDTEIIKEICRITEKDDLDKDLFYSYDGQGCMVYYGTPKQVQLLELKSDIDFYN